MKKVSFPILAILFLSTMLVATVVTEARGKSSNPDGYFNAVYAKELYIGNEAGNLHVTTSKSGDVTLGFYNNEAGLKPAEKARIEISLNSSTGPKITIRNGEARSAAGVLEIQVNSTGDPKVFLRSPRGKKAIDLNL